MDQALTWITRAKWSTGYLFKVASTNKGTDPGSDKVIPPDLSFTLSPSSYRTSNLFKLYKS
uniref:Uncharacterized protein n=1 Tax=Romanomermis culicivorax TaxID=13658 RepID=A0A915LBX2_ROMCU